ncbi:MAG: DUF2269 family protein [Deltaproteobacteria bacterium]|nr:DUF2269 family protein [Deltaproteobacteria bacterium]
MHVEVLLILHLFSVSAMLGATVVNGLLHARARRSPPSEAAPLVGGIMAVNRWVMGPSLVLIPASGVWLAFAFGFGLTPSWIHWGIGLSSALILAFVVGVWPEHRLEVLANDAAKAGREALPPAYRATFLRAAPIGFGALVLSIAAITVMVVKPT